MSDRPVRRNRTGKMYGKQKQNLTLFGEWIELLNTVCQTNQAEVAARIGIAKSLLSRATRGQIDLGRDTVLKLIRYYDGLLQEEQITLDVYWRQAFFVAWSGDELLTETIRMQEIVQGLRQEAERRKRDVNT